MKKLVEQLFTNRISKFIAAIKDACADSEDDPDKQGLALLEVTAVAFASMQQIELKLQQYNLADLDVHALTLKLFPELKGVAAGSTSELDYIDREMGCFEKVLENHKKAAIMREEQIAEQHGDTSAFQKENEEDDNQDKLLLLVMQSPSATQMVDDMIDETLAAVKRSNQLSPEADRQVNAEMIVDFFLNKIEGDTKTALKMAQEQIPLGGKQKSVTEFRKFFTFSRQVNRIVSALRGKFGSFVKVRFSEWHHTRDRIIKKVEELVEDSQGAIEAGLNTSLEGMIARVSKMLSDKQKPGCSDYLEMSGLNNTKCCTRVCDVLAKQFQFITASLQGRVLHSFIRAYSSHLYKVFVEHLTTLKFSEEATIEIKSDVKKYTDVVTQNIQDHDIVAKIEVLNDLVTVFLVSTEFVGDVLKEGKLRLMMEMDKELMHKFIKCRADYDDNQETLDPLF